MLKNVFFVPGFAGSELRIEAPPAGVIWVDYSALALGMVGNLRLAADGVAPGSPDGLACVPTVPLATYYNVTLDRLRSNLDPTVWNVVPFGYDWRKRIQSSGAALANAIRASSSNAFPATIVGHSMGGLVARWAWHDLLQTGEQFSVRRIITLGSPHQGTYYGPELFSLECEEVFQLVALSAPAFVLRILISPLLYSHPWTPSQLSKLFATWPSIYQTFPVLGSVDSAGDPLRPQLYDVTNWEPARGISASLLTEVQGDWHAFMIGVNSIPPSNVLTTVAGTGISTGNNLIQPKRLGYPDAYADQLGGDGVVTVSSALIDGSVKYILPVLHHDLPQWAANTGELVAWITEERSPITPVPPTNITTGAITPIINAPPMNTPLGGRTKRSCMAIKQ